MSFSETDESETIDDSFTIDQDWNDTSKTTKGIYFNSNNNEQIRDEEVYRFTLVNGILSITKHKDIESLEQALCYSLYNNEQPKPLVLFLYHENTIAKNIFSTNISNSSKIINYLENQFIIWVCDTTNNENDQNLLEGLQTHLGCEVVNVIQSTPIDKYPLLICCSFQYDKVIISRIINGFHSKEEIFNGLQEARDLFDTRIETPIEINEFLRSISVGTNEFQTMTHLSQLDSGRIVSIAQINNFILTSQYIRCKENIDSRVGHHETERILFHGCSYESAFNIIHSGFDPNMIGLHGSSFGSGFYFSSNPMVTHSYSTPNKFNKQRTMLVCRVLIGRSCLGDDTMKHCPDGFESTTDEGSTFVVYSSNQILPEYLVTYT